MSSATRRLRRAQEQELRKLKIKDLERSYDQVVQRLEAQKQRDAREAELRAVGVTFADDLRRPVRVPKGVQS